MKLSLLALAVMISTAGLAAACQWCMENSQSDGSSSARPPTHTPAFVSKSPKLDGEDIGFILSLEEGKRYMKLGDSIADKKIGDLWLRLLDESALTDLLKPRLAQIVADLRVKSFKKQLAKDDEKLAAHLYRDIPAAASADDWEFLRDIVAAAPLGKAAAPSFAAPLNMPINHDKIAKQ